MAQVYRSVPNLLWLKNVPTLYDFRCAFAWIMPRSGVNIFALQKLMRYSDLQVLPKTDDDVHMAHLRGNLVDINY